MTRETIGILIVMDTGISSPEQNIYNECPHTAIGKTKDDRLGNAMFKCGSVIRYYEDENYARAYSLGEYSCGFMILYNKIERIFYTFTLGEDDGSWFIEEGCYFEDKNDFVARITEATSIFNSNFKHD